MVGLATVWSCNMQCDGLVCRERRWSKDARSAVSKDMSWGSSGQWAGWRAVSRK